MYSVKDNAETKLQFWISSVATSLVVEEWTWGVFPTPPFIAVLNKRNDDWGIIKSEKIEVTAIDWDQLTITRWFDDSEATDFNAWDYVSLFVMAKHIQELQSALADIQKDIWEEWLVKPASDELAWTVKIANNDAISNVINKDERGVYYVPKVSDLVPEYIGSLFISASDIALWADTYLHTQPDYDECTQAFYVWKETSNRILDLQWLSNWRSFDTISLKLDKWWLPTTKLVVEVMSASVNWNYWSWETIIASWEVNADDITWVWLYTVLLDRTVSLSIGSPFVVRLRQTDSIVNAMNYFICYWHPTRNSDIFSWNYIVDNVLVNTWNDIYFSCLWKLTQAIRQNTNWRIIHDDSYTKYSAEVVASGFSYPFNLSSPDIDPNQPISISWTVQFVQHSNNGATLYSSSDAKWWMTYLWVESNKVRDISANWRTYTITLNNKSVSFSDLANGVIAIIWQASLSTWDHRWSECYFTISWNLTVNFTDINSWWEVQAVYIRNSAKRLWLVSATLVWKHIDWSFIYPRNDWSHAVIAWQKWDDWKKVLLKVEDKCFWYRYDWDANRTKLSDFYDFIWPEWPRGLQGPRGAMGWINYRGRLSSFNDLPDEWSIEWEAYSVWWVLYIWDWEYFRNSGISFSAVNLVLDWENIENKPDYVRISDEVAYQFTQWNYDYVWRLTERLYTQINLLWRDLNLSSWENIQELVSRWYGKIISNDYFYTNYLLPSTYALGFINKENTDNFFQTCTHFYENLNYLDTHAGFSTWDTYSDFLNNPWEVAKLWKSDIIRNQYFLKSSYAQSLYKNLDEAKVVACILACIDEDTSTCSSFSSLFSNTRLVWLIMQSEPALCAIAYNTWAISSFASTTLTVNRFVESSSALSLFSNNTDAINVIYSTQKSRNALFSSNSALSYVLSHETSSAALALNADGLNAFATNLTYLSTLLLNQQYIKHDVFTALQAYSYKIYTLVSQRLTWSNYYSSDRDRSDLSWASKIDFINNYYDFWDTAIIFPAYYWDDNDSSSQQIKSQRFDELIWYPLRTYWYWNVNIVANSSDERPMWFALKWCRLVNLWWSNYGAWVTVFTF